MRAGFPHSDICGSKFRCQLPAAFRRLARPSSPVVAKASTVCTYSLDSIAFDPSQRDTLRLQKRTPRTQFSKVLFEITSQITTSVRCNHYYPLYARPSSADAHTLLPEFLKNRPEHGRQSPPDRQDRHWWSWTGSNRRPPACKAGALPTELQPRLRHLSN